MARDDLTLGATWRRLHDLGYAATSATNPDRRISSRARRDSFIALANHPGAVMTHPTLANGAHEALEDCGAREVVALITTGYLLADTKQAKAVMSVLSDYGLLAGPVRRDGFGNELRPLRYDGNAIFDGEAAARLCFDADDSTVFLQHAIVPERYFSQQDQFGRVSQIATDPVGSHVIPIDGEWKGGSLLDVAREKLPELLAVDVTRLISDVESARWTARAAA